MNRDDISGILEYISPVLNVFLLWYIQFEGFQIKLPKLLDNHLLQRFHPEIREFSLTVSLTKYIRIVSGGGYRNPGLLQDEVEEEKGSEEPRAYLLSKFYT